MGADDCILFPSNFSTFSKLSLMSMYCFYNKKGNSQRIWMGAMWRGVG